MLLCDELSYTTQMRGFDHHWKVAHASHRLQKTRECHRRGGHFRPRRSFVDPDASIDHGTIALFKHIFAVHVRHKHTVGVNKSHVFGRRIIICPEHHPLLPIISFAVICWRYRPVCEMCFCSWTLQFHCLTDHLPCAIEEVTAS